MKKLLLPLVLLGGLGTAQVAQAQAAILIGRLIGAGVGLGINSARTSKASAAQKAAEKPQADQPTPNAPASPTELVMHRTPTDKLPKQGAEQITALEAQLERCHAAMLADPNGVVCTPEQRTAIQSAAVSVARARSGWDLQPYQQEMAFYLAEDARRQQATAPAAAPTK